MRNLIKLLLTVIPLFVLASCATQNNQDSMLIEEVPQLEIVAEDYTLLANSCLMGEDLNFTDLRIAYSKTEQFNVYTSDVVTEIRELLKTESNEEAASIIQNNIEKHLGDITFIYYAYIVFSNLEDDNAGFFRYVFWSLIESIEEGADGLTPESALNVISVREEYTYMNANNIDYGKQSLVDVDGHKYDMFTVTPGEFYESEEIYFNVDRVFEAYGRQG